MDFRRVSRISFLARLTALAFLGAAAASAGSHYQRETAIFWYDQHPDLPLERFADGDLGILQPTYARSYLYVAYRLMEGAPLMPDEHEQTLAYWSRKLERNAPAPSSGPEDYDQLRGSLEIPWQAPEAPTGSAVDYSRSSEFVYYRQCTDDAFEVAARTLAERIESFGVQSREIAEWVIGQDYVFENCFGAAAGFIPPEAPADIAPIIRADREYQIAAALFYSNRFDEAAGRFERIAADQASPWEAWGGYLAARSLLWKARAAGPGSGAYEPTLRRALALLEQTLDSSRQRPAHSAARRMLNRILVRIDKPRAAGLIAARLMSPLGAEDRAIELGQFTQLLDNSLQEPINTLAEVMDAHDLIEWVFTFQSDADGVVIDHVIDRWKRSGSVAWLLAALAKIPPEHPDAVAVMTAAADVVGHPATPSLMYYRARLMALRGDLAPARQELNELSQQVADLPSSLNRALDLRARTAASLADLADHILLEPALISFVYWDGGKAYTPWELETRVGEEARRRLKPFDGVRRLAPGAAETLNSIVPLTTFVELATADGLPGRVRQTLLASAFARAAVLGEMDIAARVAGPLGEAVPEIADRVEAFLAAAGEREQRLAAAILIVELPGASVTLRSGPIRLAPVHRVDDKGLNWWWWEDAAIPAPPRLSPTFLTALQRERAQREWRVITLLQDGYPWLLSEALVEARRAQPLEGVAELLSLALSALSPQLITDAWTYYSTNFRAAPRRAEAMHELETRFPNSEWTAKAKEALIR